MKIAYTIAAGPGDTDELLLKLSGRLADKGLKLGGTVQINGDAPMGEPCDMDIRVLPAGPTLRVSQSLGPEAKGCRLDPSVFATAVGLVEDSLAEGCDLLLINKFGKREAEGGGFRNAVGQAAAQGIPVLVGLNRLNTEAFAEFTDGAAIELEPELRALEAWAVEAAV